jgi:hypothetical protein
MYMLYADHGATLSEKTKLFEVYMEPMLQKLEAFAPTGPLPPDVPEFHQYLEVCRWPFRKLEYCLPSRCWIAKPGDRRCRLRRDAIRPCHGRAGLPGRGLRW